MTLPRDDRLIARMIFEGVNVGLDEVKTGVQQRLKTLQGSISSDLQRLIGSNEAMSYTLEQGFTQVQQGMGQIYFSIQDLGAQFEYGLGLIVDQLTAQNRTLVDISDTINKMYEVAKTPMRTRARELFLEGYALLGKGLLDKSLEYFHKSAEVYDVDFFTQLYIGKLYLYGKGEDCDVTDPKKAAEHLMLAVRYGKATLSEKPEMKKATAEALLHASIACYLLSMKTYKNSQVEGAKLTEERQLIVMDKLMRALDFAYEAIELNPNLSEGHYHAAKYNALLEKLQSSCDFENIEDYAGFCLSDLEDAIKHDRTYVLKVAADDDFDEPEIRTGITKLIGVLKDKIQEHVKLEVESLSGDVGKLNLPNIGWADPKEAYRLYHQLNGLKSKYFEGYNCWKRSWKGIQNELISSLGILKQMESYFVYKRREMEIYFVYKRRDLQLSYSESLMKSKDLEMIVKQEQQILQEEMEKAKAEIIVGLAPLTLLIKSGGYLDLLEANDKLPIIRKKIQGIHEQYDKTKVKIEGSHKLLMYLIATAKKSIESINRRIANKDCVVCGDELGLFARLMVWPNHNF